MECDHQIFLQGKLLTNYELIETKLDNFVEYNTFRCNYCGHTLVKRENLFVTIVGFFPRLSFYIIVIPFYLLLKLLKNIFEYITNENDF
jgi:hypothetical protein